MKSFQILLPVVLIAAFLAGCADLIEPLDSIDGNDTPETAILFPRLPQVQQGTVSVSADVDYFRFVLSSPRHVAVTLAVPDDKDYNLYLMDSHDSIVGLSRGANGVTESIDIPHLNAGTYFIKILSENGAYSETQLYRLSAADADTGQTPNLHLSLGNPSQSETHIASPRNYLIARSQYAVSYDNVRRIPNWCAWHLNKNWLGTIARQDNFKTDILPAGWYAVKDGDYTGSGYDRGHMCPSGDRNAVPSDNVSTFYMTNILPQASDNNQGPWVELESYCRDLAGEGYELFIMSGHYDSLKTIASGKVTVPVRVWKIIVVLPHEETTPDQVTTLTRVIAVDMPNTDGIRSTSWKSYRTSVDQIETSTGYDFLNRVPAEIQSVIESQVDNK